MAGRLRRYKHGKLSHSFQSRTENPSILLRKLSITVEEEKEKKEEEPPEEGIYTRVLTCCLALELPVAVSNFERSRILISREGAEIGCNRQELY